jgi:K+/H+ antiporter YhaU regulatory subunit KhtT
MSVEGANIFHHTGLRPIALQHPGQEDFCYNPDPGEILKEGTVMIVVGGPEQLLKMRKICASNRT